MGGRIVSAEEARALGLADATGAVDRARYQDLAHTVITQAEQIAAVLALHTHGPLINGREVCDTCSGLGYEAWPCPTARALGVTE